jgi:hypothetical protein
MSTRSKAALVLVVLVVVAVLLFATWRMRTSAPPAGEPRKPAGQPIDTTLPGAPLEPLGEVSGPIARFTWRADPSADLYRLEVYDLAGEMAGVSVQRDTTITAEAMRLDTLRAGRWRVVTVGAGGSERPARGEAEFRVVPR